MEIAPLVATSARPVATTFRPCASSSARPTFALGFQASCGSTPKRPSTARGGATSARRTFSNSTAEWSFLDTAADGANPCVRVKAPPRHRSVTSREHSVGIHVVLPKRPVTARATTRLADAKVKCLDNTCVHIEAVAVTDTRAICEAAHREQEQEQYSDPLYGKSVEPRVTEIATRSADSAMNAVNRHEALRVKAFHARARGDYAHAIACYAKAVDLEPSDHLSRFQLAVALERTGSLERALAAYEHVLAQQPTNHFAHYNVANILMRLDRVDAAIEHYTSAVECCDARDPQRIVFFRQRGAAYRKNGDFEKASRDYAYYHARCGHFVKQSDRPWEAEPSSYTDADNAVDANCKSQAVHTRHEDARPKASRVLYSADSLYAVPASLTLEQTEVAYDTWTRQQVFEKTRSRRSARSADDLSLLMDALQKVFPVCAVLRPEACTVLCARVVGLTNIRAGTPLFLETMSGSHVFFVYRGRVSTYKTIVQRIVQVTSSSVPSDQASAAHMGAENEADEDHPTQSWESVYAELGQNESDEATLPTALRQIAPITSRWSKRQMELRQFGHGDVLGFQGRHSQDARTYSTIVTEDSDILALSWQDLVEVERLQRAAEADAMSRFLRTVPAFHDIPVPELLALSLRAKRVKPIGSKVVCSEGQFVDGIFVVREGEACQLSPSDLRLPPDLSIAFNLCGAFAVQPHEQEKTRREFFAQLEFAGDPLAFAHLSDVVYGFLPHDFIDTKVQQLQAIVSAKPPQRRSNSAVVSTVNAIESAELRPAARRNSQLLGSKRQPIALSLPRGGCFVASSAWIPPRRSRQAQTTGSGVARAKSALVSRSSADLLFFTSSDVVASLSLASRAILQRNTLASVVDLTHSHMRKSSGSAVAKAACAGETRSTPAIGHDMLEQLAWTQNWTKYKAKLVAAVLQDKKTNRPRSSFQSAR